MPRAPGLPAEVRACLFDLDGVLTRTAELHAQAWKEMFDGFLQDWARRHRAPFRPFDRKEDYDEYLDGKPRYDGVRSFLQARGIRLPEGTPGDPPGRESVCGLGNRKNRLVLELLRRRGVRAYPGSVRYVRRLRALGVPRAVVSSSTNCREVLRSAGLDVLFETVVDGVGARREHLRGKPAPDTYLAAARRLGIPPGSAAIFEDALAGVEAGRAGRFLSVVGVDRVGQTRELYRHGATVVVSDLSELLGRA